MLNYKKLTDGALTICDQVSRFSSNSDFIKRFSMTTEMDKSHEFLASLFYSHYIVEKDRVGNILFKNKKYNKNQQTLLFGSHLDTVENAGKYDGVLGVVIGLIIGRELANSGVNVDVVGFSDEEGGVLVTDLLVV